MKANKSEEGHMRYIIVVFLCALFSLTSISVVSSRPFRTGKIPGNLGCNTCHFDPRGGGKLNPFGQDYKKIGIPAGEKYTKELGALDSDGDGSTNDQEFSAGKHPGDPDSKP
jgi:hypothetical protein